MIEGPQSFVTGQNCDKAAADNGFRRRLEETDGWRRYESTTVQGSVWLAFEDSGLWLLAVDHAGVVSEIGLESAKIDGPGLARFRFEELSGLHEAMHRHYELAASLPNGPLMEFERRVEDMPRATEAERLVVQRVGQDIFREGLMRYWRGRCPLTGIEDQPLLRASHMKPWKDCVTDEERLDIYNGLLLSGLWDAAFDRGLVTFGDNGRPRFSQSLSDTARSELRWCSTPMLTEAHLPYLRWHRESVFDKEG